MSADDRYQEPITKEMAKSILPEDVYDDKYEYSLVMNLENTLIVGFNPDDETDRMEYVCKGSESLKLDDLLDDDDLQEAYVMSGGKKSDFRYYKKVGNWFSIFKNLIIITLVILVLYLYGVQKL